MKSREELKYYELMEPYRKRIDNLDKEIVKLFAARMDIMREVALFKYKNNIDAVLPDRIEMVKDHVCLLSEKYGLNPNMVRDIYTIMIDESCKTEDSIINNIDNNGKTK